MSAFRNIVSWFFPVAATMGCNPAPPVFEDAGAYITAYRQVEGIVLEKCIEETCVEVTFQAPDHTIARELARGLITSQTDLQSRKAALEKELMFTLKISGEKQSSQAHGTYTQQPVTTELILEASHLHIETGNGEIPCALVHGENEPGLRPFLLYHTLFTAPEEPLQDFTLVVDHPTLGILKFHYPETLLQSLPVFKPKPDLL